MADIKRAQCSRRGYRAHLKKILASVDELLTNPQPLSEDNVATLRDLHEQLGRKHDLITPLDTKILEATEDEDAIEAEVLQAEETNTAISTAKAKIAHRLSAITVQSSGPSPPPPPTTDRHVDHDSRVTRLPKLELPQFSGNPLMWQSFWDIFEASVHNSNSLTGVQKLSYLRSQLQGEAAHVIAGFQLTGPNYTHSVDLLKERFGQPYKQIDAHMQALIDLQSPSATLVGLRDFHDAIEGHIRSLASLGQSQNTYGSLLVTIILGKLPTKIKQNLARTHGRQQWDLDELQKAILDEIYILEVGSHTDTHTPPLTPTASFHTGASSKPTGTRSKPQCVFCKKPHSPTTCDTIKDARQRCDIVRQEKLCFNCLGHHKVSSCTSRHRCHNCRRKHHTSLCSYGQQLSEPAHSTSASTGRPPQPTHIGPPNHGVHLSHTTPPANTTQQLSSTSPVTNSTNQPDTAALSMTTPQPRNSVCLLKTAIATITHGNRSATANLLFDEGSQRSFITHDLANSLELQPYKREDINISSFGANCHLNRQMDVVMIHLLGNDGQTTPLSVLVIPRIATPIQHTASISMTHLPHLQNLQLAHPLTAEREFEISLLVGADHYWDIVGDHVVRGTGGPTAVASKLGYLLSGPVHLTKTLHTGTSTMMLAISQPCTFDLERFWSLESVGVSVSEVSSEQHMLQQYVSSCVTRDPDGAYVARFPWKPNPPSLPNNFVVTERRTRQMLKRLVKTPNLLSVYSKIIAEQEARGFIERVEPANNQCDVHYIPHHAVEKNSATTPIRIVFDCSCRQSSGYPSLNDCLLIGSPCVNDLCAILVRFRCHCYGISTDIEKAFLHVRLHPDDRDYTRFFWLTDPTDVSSQFCTYRFKVVPFGATSSPFMLNAVLQYHLQQHNTVVSSDIRSNLYVDNVITGGATEQAVVSYYREARSLMSSANMNLRSWSSNSAELKTIATADNVGDDSQSVSILGLRWNPTTDELALTAKPTILTHNHLTTKREVLQDISKIFDPLGLAAPVVIRAKLLMQKLWICQVTWDEPLSEDLCTEWREIATDLVAVTRLSIRRRYFEVPFTHPVLHCFADASLKAYGAVVFFVLQNEVSFVAAKSRVAPLKQLTLPRLELMAALVATRLTQFVLNTIELPDPSIFIWSDSQIVLHWVKSQKELPAFVRHRVTEIQSSLPTAVWKYCPTLENPADLLTRGITTEALMSSSLWQNGPAWLTTPNNWPSFDQPNLPPLLVAAATASEFVPAEPDTPAVGIHCVVSLNRYSSLCKLLCVTAYVFRFIDNVRTEPDHRNHGPVTAAEFTKVRLRWVKDVQHDMYKKEVANLKLVTREPRASRALLVRQLRLFLDESEMLHCGGRIHNAPVSNMTKFPYLLPSRHPFSRLIILDLHVTLHHSGVSATLTALRQTYWIPAARQYIRSILRHCVSCTRVIGKPYSAPDPPPLPHLRTQDVHPFTFTGVDFTGAMYVRQAEQEVKVYLCLFTCATTRAIHLEIVQDLTVDTFLLAFRKFAGRRSLPKVMISDNGSTYMSAAEELRQLMNSTEVREQLGRRGVTWQFIPKRAPWFGGFWERLVGLTKTAIKKVLGRRHVSLPTLETIVVEIEAILNDRPLTYVSSELSDPEPLTPSHLLHGRRITCLPYQTVELDELTDPSFGDASRTRKRAVVQAVILRDFQTRWRHEYLTSLREYHKASGKNIQSVKKGDVVIVHEDTPRMTWRLAVIKDLIIGRDGLIRAAVIKTANGTTNRPITRLYPLELTADVQGDGPRIEKKQPQQVTCDIGTAEAGDEEPRPKRASARRAMAQFKNWATILAGPPEDVATAELDS